MIYTSVHLQSGDTVEVKLATPSILLIQMDKLDVYIKKAYTPELFAEWCSMFKVGEFAPEDEEPEPTEDELAEFKERVYP